MITHIVLFKLKNRTAEEVEGALRALRALEGVVPTLRGLTVGADVVQAARSYDIGLIARFDDLAGLKAYREHPEHVAVAKYLGSISSSIVAVDFEEK